MTRITPTTPMKERTSASIRKLAAEVAQTFPDMSVHDHLKDAARELDGGRIDGAKRHLNAAIEGFAPLQITRHGVHDDEGHRTAKLYMQQSYRHLLNVRDIEDTRARNEGMMEHRRMQAALASGKTFLPSSQPIPVGAPNGAAGPVASAPAVAPQAQGLKALAWEDIMDAIELATFAGAKPGSGKNFAKLKGSLAARGARNPAALAAYIGRKKYGKKGFAKLGQKHANPAGGIELVGPKGYIHGWIKASMSALVHSGGGAYLPEHPSFGVMTPKEHRQAAAGHLAMMKRAPEGSDKARLHHKFAKLHAAASAGIKGAQRSGATFARAPRTGVFASDQDAIELVFNPRLHPRGKHGRFAYVGTPKSKAGMIAHLAHGHGQGLPTGRTGFQRETRTLADFQKVHDEMHRMNPGQNHTHEPLATTKVTAGRHYGTGETSIRDFEALASMPPFTPEQNQMLGIATPDWYKKIAAPIKATIQASWEDLDRAIQLSADTGRLATEHHPFGKPGGPGLWGVKGMELPPYIQNIARALLRTGRAKTLSQAIAIARGASKRWAAGGGNVRPEVRAASQATSADWSAKQARAHAHSNPDLEFTWSALDRAIELAGFNPAEPRGAAGTWGGSGTTAAAGLDKKQLQQRVRADRIKLRALNAQLAKLTTIKKRTTASAQKAAATGKTAAATPAKKGAPAKAVAGGKKAPTRGQLITSLRAQIKQLTVQIAADEKRIAALANEPGGLLLAS
jgi:hypothetical protein